MLITTNEELDLYATQPGMAIKLMKPYLEMAEQRYLKKVLSADQLADLTAYYELSIAETPTPLDQEEVDLLHACRQAIVPLAFYLGADNLDVQVDASGVRRAENENHKTAYEYQKKGYKQNQFLLGLERLDSLYSFLEEHIADYGFYAASPERVKLQKLLIRTLAEFEEHLNLGNSYWLFLHMIDIMDDVEQTQVIPQLGDYYETIKTKLDAGTSLDTDETTLLKYARKAICNLSVIEVIDRLPVKLNQDGALMIYAENTKTINATMPADLAKLEALKKQRSKTANLYLEKLKEKIDELTETSNEPIANTTQGGYLGF